MNKIYTRTGDTGETGLVDGSRRKKYDLRVEAYGDVDESNSAIGMVRLHLAHGSAHDDMLKRIQHDLFDMGADLSTPYVSAPSLTLPLEGEGSAVGAGGGEDKALRIIPSQVSRLEDEIDQLNEHIAPLNSFVLPGGSAASAHLHLARTIVRRTERVAYALATQEQVNPEALKYLNRLSDFLFVLARACNNNGVDDVLWQPGVNR